MVHIFITVSTYLVIKLIMTFSLSVVIEEIDVHSLERILSSEIVTTHLALDITISI